LRSGVVCVLEMVMQKALTVVVVAGVFGAVAAVGMAVSRDGKLVSALGRGLVSGVILGSNVWPHQPGLTPADVRSRVLASGYEQTAISSAN
jgi:hypothetical protein